MGPRPAGDAGGGDLREQQAGPEHPRWFERYQWVVAAWVVGVLMAVIYGSPVLAGRRNPNFHADHPWVSAMTFAVPLAVLLAAWHSARGEASVVGTLLSTAVVIVLGGVFWRFWNPLR